MTFLCNGISQGWTKNIVLFPVGILVPTPCARRPKSLAKAVSHIDLSGPFIRCLYSIEAPVIGSITGHAKWCWKIIVLGVSARRVAATAYLLLHPRDTSSCEIKNLVEYLCASL